MTSLLERAAEVYDFGAALRRPRPAQAPSATPPVPLALVPAIGPAREAAPVDRERLLEEGFLLPEAPVGALLEEFRLVKRALLLRRPDDPPTGPRDRAILVSSAQANEGKTFCAVNLALSIAAERERRVLLVDGDVAKPEVLSTLGVEGGPGLLDAVAQTDCDPERFVIPTDIPNLSVLPAGRASADDTELLGSQRAAAVVERLLMADPARIVVFDSAPLLAASPAAVLAHLVGRVVVVVRADRTGEGELRNALALLDGAPRVDLLLNGASRWGSHRAYGSYYGADR